LSIDKAQIKKEFQGNFKSLRTLLNSWELIPGVANDEFDSLNHQLLSHLYKGSDLEKISRFISSELTVYYGLSCDVEESKQKAEEIMGWWNYRNNTAIK